MTRTRQSHRQAPRLERLEAREVLAAGGLSAQGQYLLELINEARTNPSAAAERVSSDLDGDDRATLAYFNVDLNQVKREIASTPARPPVAYNDRLTQAAQAHSQDQANAGIQSHTGSDGSGLGTRLDRVSYNPRQTASENVYAYSESVDHAMEAFLIDWGVSDKGHRNNILQPKASDPAFQEVGLGITSASRNGLGPFVVTQNFARSGGKAQLVGVAYDDRDRDHFYTPGEGRGDVSIDVVNVQNGQTKSTNAWDSGGYQIPLDPGQYRVTARVGSRVVRSQSLSVGSDNVKIDFDLSQPWQVTTPPPVSTPTSPVSTPTPTPTPLPVATTPVAPRVFFESRSATTTTTVTRPKTEPVVTPIAPTTTTRVESNLATGAVVTPPKKLSTPLEGARITSWTSWKGSLARRPS